MLARAWHIDGGVAGELSAELPDNHVPADRALAAKPRLIELCFQTAGLLGLATEGVLGLPNAIERVVFPAYPEGGNERTSGSGGGGDTSRRGSVRRPGGRQRGTDGATP